MFHDRGPRRFIRKRKLLAQPTDYMIMGKHKFGIEKVVGYASLKHEMFCFASNLNKFVEPCF